MKNALCPFTPGQAVAILTLEDSYKRRRLICGVVTRANPATGRVTVLEPSGRRRSVGAFHVCHRALCPACEAPAVQGERGPVCPRCHRPATLPPPDKWLRKAFGGDHHDIYQRYIARMLAGASWDEAGEMIGADDRERQRVAREAAQKATGREVWLSELPEPVHNKLEQLADAGDVEGYVALYEMVTAAPASFSALLALHRVEKAEGADAVRRVCLAWLDRLDDLAATPPPPLEPADDREPDAARTPPPAFLRSLFGPARRKGAQAAD